MPLPAAPGCTPVQAPFGEGVPAVAAAANHLGYVQIDTINVIERCHHHILFNRIPDYRRCPSWSVTISSPRST
jgi:hypothetical protein